jgi:hypothetical protein
LWFRKAAMRTLSSNNTSLAYSRPKDGVYPKIRRKPISGSILLRLTSHQTPMVSQVPQMTEMKPHLI